MKKVNLQKFSTLRGRIMMCFSLSLFVMFIILFSVIRLDVVGMQNLGNAYKSNTELNYFSLMIAQTEKAMENYVDYHSYESINAYYAGCSKVEEFLDLMQSNPSNDEVLQKEYIVKQFSKSFVYYSNKAIIARRSNSTETMNLYYKKTLDCYNMLLSQVLELNKLLLQKNALEYEQSHNNYLITTRFYFWLFTCFAFLIFCLIYLMITNLTRPLAEISEVAHRVSNRDFDVPLFNNYTKDEIGNICQAFDRMIISIREYIDTIWEKARTEAEFREKEIEMQALYTDAQLRALQNQINPHFLFNTLNTGSQLAMMEGADKTCYFIEQVADFFRYNIQQQSKIATIDEELGLVDNFVYIMKVRFGNRLEFIKDIPNQNFPQQIPVMTLQPIVENCIKYGLKNTTGRVVLSIKLERKFIVINISDNGTGMDKEIKKHVFEAVKNEKTRLPSEIVNKQIEAFSSVENTKHTGTGLINVFLRLKLYFHRDDIFDITKGENGEGTKFIIKVPKNV